MPEMLLKMENTELVLKFNKMTKLEFNLVED